MLSKKFGSPAAMWTLYCPLGIASSQMRVPYNCVWMNVSCCWSGDARLLRSRANALADRFQPYVCPFPRLPKTAPLSAKNPAGVGEVVVWKLILIGGVATGVISTKSSLLFTEPVALLI